MRLPPSELSSLHHDLATTLRRLHKALLEAEARHYGPVGNPYELLNLALHHSQFAWLRRLSELIVELDEVLDEEEAPTSARYAAFKTAIEALVGPGSARDTAFRKRYLELLQESPAAAMAHGELRRLLARLPDEQVGKPTE